MSATKRNGPMAAQGRSGPAGLPALVLDETVIEVELVPPLAKVLIARRLTNSSDRLIEAELTLPPVEPDEVIYRLVVSVDGVDWPALPQLSGPARRAHDAAVAEGRRAILYERLEHDIPRLSIAGIEPGARVEIISWSIRPLARLGADKAALRIPLGSTRQADLTHFAGVNRGVTTSERHAATLRVGAGSRQVTLHGQPHPDRLLRNHEAIDVEYSTPILLEVVALEAGSLDHCEWQVDKPGGWEATSERGIETFRHPANPGGWVASDRTDWIFGVMSTPAGEIRVTAPLHSDGYAPTPQGLHGLAPNAWGMRAFAAAAYVESAMPHEPDTVRLAAQIVDRRTSLAYIA